MEVKGKAKIYKSEYNGNVLYSTGISKKNEDGKYENMYVSCHLPKDAQLENGEMIEITKGFLTFYTDKNNLPKIKIVIMEYKQEEKGISDNDLDLPF